MRAIYAPRASLPHPFHVKIVLQRGIAKLLD
jgi:hypothetical protein